MGRRSTTDSLPVDNVERVEVGDGSDDLCDVEQRRVQAELPVTSEVGEQFSATDL